MALEELKEGALKLTEEVEQLYVRLTEATIVRCNTEMQLRELKLEESSRIAQELNEAGKPKFSNAELREAELNRCFRENLTLAEASKLACAKSNYAERLDALLQGKLWHLRTLLAVINAGEDYQITGGVA